MKIGYYIYGVFTFLYMTVASFFITAHLHGQVGYRKGVLIDELEDEEMDAEIEEIYNEW